MTTRTRCLAAVLAFACALGGCGGGGSPSAPSSTPTPTPFPTPVALPLSAYDGVWEGSYVYDKNRRVSFTLKSGIVTRFYARVDTGTGCDFIADLTPHTPIVDPYGENRAFVAEFSTRGNGITVSVLLGFSAQEVMLRTGSIGTNLGGYNCRGRSYFRTTQGGGIVATRR